MAKDARPPPSTLRYPRQMRVDFSNLPCAVAQFLVESEAQHLESLADSIAISLGLNGDDGELLEAYLAGTIAEFIDGYLKH